MNIRGTSSADKVISKYKALNDIESVILEDAKTIRIKYRNEHDVIYSSSIADSIVRDLKARMKRFHFENMEDSTEPVHDEENSVLSTTSYADPYSFGPDTEMHTYRRSSSEILISNVLPPPDVDYEVTKINQMGRHQPRM